jgi:hypothetical protein
MRAADLLAIILEVLFPALLPVFAEMRFVVETKLQGQS